MANETTNYKLPKPEADDFYDISEYNKTMDLLDDSLTEMEKKKLDKNGDASDVVTEFEPEVLKKNIESGEKLSETHGKIKKWFSEMKDVAFSGKAKDVISDAAHRFVTDTEKNSWNKKASTLDGDMMVYVATTGSDTTGDGSTTAPYKTINYALSKLPKMLNNYTGALVVAAGTYTESVSISGFTGDLQILLQGNITVTSISVEYSSVLINSFTTTKYAITTQWVSVRNRSTFASYSSVDYNITGSLSNAITGRTVSVFAAILSNMYMSGKVTLSGNVDVAVGVLTKTNVYIGCLSGTGFTTGHIVDTLSYLSFGRNNLLASTQTILYSGGITVSQFGAKIGTLSADSEVFVSTTGSDTTGDGTSAKPFRTIQHAIDILPKDLGGKECIITVADGTYDEDLLIVCFANGVLRLSSPHITTASENCKIKSIVASHNSCYLFITGFNVTTNTNTKHGIDCYNDKAIIVRACMVVGASKDWAGLRFAECDFQAYDNIVSNRGIALHAYKSTGVSGWWADSSNNGVGLYSMIGSNIHKIGAQPNGTTMEAHDTGGMFINENGTQISNLVTTGLGCTWGIIRGGFYRQGNSNGAGTAIVTVQLNIVTTDVLSTGQVYSIIGFPIAEEYDFAVAINRPRMFDHVWFAATVGNIRVNPAESIPAGTVLLFNCTYMTAY